MSLRKLIVNKTMAAFAVIFTAFSSASVFAQDAAAAATEKVVDMGEVHKTAVFYVLMFLLLCLFIAIIGKSLKVYELTRDTQGKPQGVNWDTINAVLFALFLIVGLYGVYWEYTVHGDMLLPEAASDHGKKIDEMFNLTLIITTVVFIVTHIALFSFAYLYRHSNKRKAYYYPHNNTLEKIWTLLPALVLSLLVLKGFLTWKSIFYKVEDPKNRAINIEVTSSQFVWDLRYPGPDAIVGKKNYKLITAINGLGIDFNDRNSLDDLIADEIVIPVNRPVRFVLTSKDVLHSFYMPHFRVQLNTVPGMTSYFEFTPTITTEEMRTKTNDPKFSYILLCAKICGANHFNMQKNVRVVSDAEYNQWLKEQTPYLTNDLRKAFNLPVAADAVVVADTTATAAVVKLDAKNQLALKK